MAADFVPERKKEKVDEPVGMDEMPYEDLDDGGEYMLGYDMSEVDLSDVTKFEI